MKSVIINGREILYQVEHIWEEGYYDPTKFKTFFYEGHETLSRKMFYLFGPTVTTQNPKEIFSINEDIENPKFSASEVEAMLSEKLSLYDNQVKRKEEILSGKLV